jgi:hypothetical protein
MDITEAAKLTNVLAQIAKSAWRDRTVGIFRPEELPSEAGISIFMSGR